MWEIDLRLSDAVYDEIYKWCQANLPSSEGLIWQVHSTGWCGWEDGVAGRQIIKSYTWSFTRQEDAIQFKLTWCYESV
jgi:hypothetical protein